MKQIQFLKCFNDANLGNIYAGKIAKVTPKEADFYIKTGRAMLFVPKKPEIVYNPYAGKTKAQLKKMLSDAEKRISFLEKKPNLSEAEEDEINILEDRIIALTGGMD